MNSASTQFVVSRRMNIYESLNQVSSWVETYRDGSFPIVPPSTIIGVQENFDNLSSDASLGAQAPPNKYDQEASKPIDKVQRRLAQNREAARKSRLRKKAYVQQLEMSRSKLMQLEQELERTRQQGLYVGGGIDHLPYSTTVNSGIVAFEMEYGHWVEQQKKQICELRTALNAHITDIELRILVDSGMNHYLDLFRLKATAAKADIFYLMSGVWKTSAERFFLWIGGFRPSELLKVLSPHLDPLTDQQVMDVYNLKQSCEQAEEALSQGMEKLQQTLSETVAAGQLGEGSYIPHMDTAVVKLETLISFANQVLNVLFSQDNFILYMKNRITSLIRTHLSFSIVGDIKILILRSKRKKKPPIPSHPNNTVELILLITSGSGGKGEDRRFRKTEAREKNSSQVAVARATLLMPSLAIASATVCGKGASCWWRETVMVEGGVWVQG